MIIDWTKRGPDQQRVHEIIEFAGGPSAVAKKIGNLTSQAVNHWKAKGQIPPEHALSVHAMVKRRYTLKDVCPRVFGKK